MKIQLKICIISAAIAVVAIILNAILNIEWYNHPFHQKNQIPVGAMISAIITYAAIAVAIVSLIAWFVAMQKHTSTN